MKVLEIEIDEKHGAGRFYIWVWSTKVYERWAECPFAFKFEDGKVYFLLGGQDDKNRRLAGEAQNMEEAAQKSIEYLKWWLKECGAIGTLETHMHLKINREGARGSGFFTLQVWAFDMVENQRRDTLFAFVFEDGQLYYLGNDKEERRELVKFRYLARDDTKKEIIASPRDKEEAIQDAVDFLEWELKRGGEGCRFVG